MAVCGLQVYCYPLTIRTTLYSALAMLRLITVYRTGLVVSCSGVEYHYLVSLLILILMSYFIMVNSLSGSLLPRDRPARRDNTLGSQCQQDTSIHD